MDSQSLEDLHNWTPRRNCPKDDPGGIPREDSFLYRGLNYSMGRSQSQNLPCNLHYNPVLKVEPTNLKYVKATKNIRILGNTYRRLESRQIRKNILKDT